jgi:two-component system chemotaxis response regulator CheY
MPLARSLTVLSVDDQAAMRMLTRNALKSIGIGEVLEACDGEEALRVILARKQPISLILSDVNMPGIDGIGLLRAVRSHTPIAKTPFILLTGWADQELVAKAIKFGVNSLVAKPFTVTSLKEKMVAVLGTLQ